MTLLFIGKNINTMKTLYSIFNVSLFMGLILMMGSCSQDVSLDNEEQEKGVWHSANVQLNINCARFDQGGDDTRATVNAWQDGDVVYLLLSGKDGKTVSAYIRYDGTMQDWSTVMFEGEPENLNCITYRVAKAYFMEGLNFKLDEEISLTGEQAVYSCTEGTYVFPPDGDMIVNISLVPLTGRIRFEGTPGTTISFRGVKTYSTFNRSTGEFTTSTNSVTTTVDANGSTPYIYCEFADAKNPTLIVERDMFYRTTFDASSSVLKPGKSGFLKIPTNTDHEGWTAYFPTRTFKVNGIEFKMIYVEPGTFQMGSTDGDNDEQPVHSVTLTKGYYMGETEVTQALWKAVTGSSPVSGSSFQWTYTHGQGPNYPAYYISYEDVVNFIIELNWLTGERFRTPTEAEWEFAARGGNKSNGYKFSGSDEIDHVAWYTSNSGSTTHPVKTKAANELGLYDMSGNVWEWCSDRYAAYSSSAQTAPTEPTEDNSNRVLRGGSWLNNEASCRCTRRSFNAATYCGIGNGFRLAL